MSAAAALLVLLAIVWITRGRRTNCLNVALVAWLRSGCRTWLAGRRSHGKQGRMVHFGAMAEGGELVWRQMPDGAWHARPDGTTLYVLDYAPPDGQRKDSIRQAGAFPLLFDGLYYLRRYRLEAEGVGNTFDAAVGGMITGGRELVSRPATTRTQPRHTPARCADQ